MLGLSQEEISDRFNDIVAFADIGEFIEQPVKTYSSGMMVRLAFAVAINVDARILIVDEALSVGDEKFQRKCFSRIETIKKNGATILFVSHSGNTVVDLCDRAVLLDAGEKLAIGTPKNIVGKYQKLLYAPQDKSNEIREEIRTSNTRKQTLYLSDDTLQMVAQETSEDIIFNDNKIEEMFDPDLKPQSTLEYAPHGAYIESPKIFSATGQRVNYLIRGKTYLYTYKVNFDESATNIRFGMLIKTITGFELGGAVSAPNMWQSIPFVAAGVIATVEFWFVCNLNPGLYFLNAGVTGTHQEEEIYLHRVMDACMFKIVPITNNIATAVVDFNCVAKVNLT